MKEINIGLVGYGTVGSGLCHILKQNSGIIITRTGIKVNLKAVCDLKTDAVKKDITDAYVTDKWEEIVNDKEIDTVIELIGGIEPAKSIILSALRNGKNVVTANKKLLAENGDEIFKTASEFNSKLGFEASVGGGIPCIMALKHGLVGNRIKSVTGILNGTTNYILTQMEEMGLSFSEVLKDAQEKGFAEADPTFDIEGYDAGHKIALLAMLSYNKRIDFGSVLIEGITRISEKDIKCARAMGYSIKLLGIAKLIDDKLDIRVHPTMIPEKHPLASVRDEFNAVMFDGDMTDQVILFGKGAGSNPTASAVISDVVQIAETDSMKECGINLTGDADYIMPEKRISRYYLRMHTEDQPGILSKISGILEKFNISIASVIQKELGENCVPLIIMTHKSREDEINSAVEEIRKFSFIHGDVIQIRVEDSLYPGEYHAE